MSRLRRDHFWYNSDRMPKITKITSALTLILAISLFLSPLLLIWITDDYQRYVWVINGPYPFNTLYDGPFMLRLTACLYFLGGILLAISFLLRGNKKNKKRKKK